MFNTHDPTLERGVLSRGMFQKIFSFEQLNVEIRSGLERIQGLACKKTASLLY